MRRQMLVINVVLLVAALALGARVRGDWKRANQRYAALATAGAATPPAFTPVSGRMPVSADTDVVAQHNLFSPDRNNDLPKTAERKPPPPEPILVGTMNVGSGRIALMAEASAKGPDASRPVKEGETIGGYRVVRIGDNEVVLEFEGQQRKVDVYTAAQQVPAPAGVVSVAAAPQVTSTGAAPAAAPDTASKVNSTAQAGAGVGPTGKIIPGTDSVYGYNDKLPAGTVMGDYRKVIVPFPFGDQVWWERIKPESKKP